MAWVFFEKTTVDLVNLGLIGWTDILGILCHILGHVSENNPNIKNNSFGV